MNDYNLKQLERKGVLVIVSTHGDGEPLKWLKIFTVLLREKGSFTDTLKFSVLALGDKVIIILPNRKDIDYALKKAGASDLTRWSLHVDYEENAAGWMNGVIEKLAAEW
jgi:sulfite reductase alpha subunit-like flavoprotein